MELHSEKRSEIVLKDYLINIKLLKLHKKIAKLHIFITSCDQIDKYHTTIASRKDTNCQSLCQEYLSFADLWAEDRRCAGSLGSRRDRKCDGADDDGADGDSEGAARPLSRNPSG